MSAVENTNRVIAAALIAPVPSGTLTEQLMYSKGVKSFTRRSAGVYVIELEEPAGSNEATFKISQPVNQNAIIGAQVLGKSQSNSLGVSLGAVYVTAYDSAQNPADPLFFYFEVLKYSEGEGSGVTLPIQDELTPVTPASAVVLDGYIFGFEVNSPDSITATQVRLGIDPDNFCASDFDSSPKVYMSSFAPLLIDGTVVGANGLDTGTLVSDTWYACYVIANAAGTLVAGLLSLNYPGGVAPVLPTGYTKKRYVGSVFTQNDESGVTFVKTFTVQGKGNNRRYQWQSYVNVLATPGNATVATTVDLTAAMPPNVATFVQLKVTLESPTGVPGSVFFGRTTSPGNILSQNGQADPGGSPLVLDYFVQDTVDIALDSVSPPGIIYSVSNVSQQASMDVSGWYESI